MLKIENLNTVLSRDESVTILDNINFELNTGEIIGIIGESGSGKTQTAMTILNLLPLNIKISKGTIKYNDLELNNLSPKEMKNILGQDIAIIPQESLSSLNPLLTAGYQISETMISHKKTDKRSAKQATLKILKQVGFENPENIFSKYPHELSGGMRQKILIAIAISCKPNVIIADEPTSSLDTVSEKEIITLLKKINEEHNTSIIFITHNIALAKEFCNKILVMYKSQIVESGSYKEVFENPKHEYTKELINSI